MSKRPFKAFDHDMLVRQTECIAQGALTNSKRAESFVKGVYPTHLKRQQGAYSWDTLDNRYIDFTAALGTSIFGFNHDEVKRSILSQLNNGTTFSLATELEIQCAEKIKELVPFVDHVRFLKTGTEAAMAAVRIARAYTGRHYVYSSGYHGWSDEFVSLSPPHKGVPPLNFTKKCEETFSEAELKSAAAVIVEPFMTDMSDERIKWLKNIRALCTQNKTLLIFDEIITGFRVPQFSVARYIGVEPDLILFGKAIANGMPLSVVAGKKEVMNTTEYFVSSTFAGETLSLAAALKTMTLLQVKFDLKHLWGKGAQFMFQFNSLWPEGLKIEGYPTRGVFKGEEMTRALFFQESVKAGLLFGPSFFFNFSHIELMEEVIAICRDVLGRIKTGSVKLEGELPVTPFAQRVRQ